MRGLSALLLLGLSVPVAAQAPGDGAEDPLALRPPQRLTAGAANHYMGALVGDALYFVGDDEGTSELYVQRPTSAAPAGVLGGLGDVAWPTASPDRQRLAYVSFARDATGDACVLTLASGRERCVTGPETAELQAVWLDDATLAVLSREGLHGDFALRRVPANGGAAETLRTRNLVGLAASPDGRWLAYVGLERERDGVGVTFASRTATGLWLERRDRPGDPVRYRPALPGKTGVPAFGPGGTFLYFTQYLNDTNRDGVIDGDDNGVIVRVPFRPDAAEPVGAVVPEQLTSARWNCHYPAVEGDRLVMTCAPRGASLDVYVLPASGAVPAEMSADALRGEIAVARDLWTKLLLEGRLLAATEDRAIRAGLLRDMAFDHLLLRELESAYWYAERLAVEAGAAGAAGAEDRRWAALLATLAQHRQADRELAQGALSPSYIEGARARLARAAVQEDDTATTRALATLVRYEMLDDIGEEGPAREALASLSLAGVDCPRTLRLAAREAQRSAARSGDGDPLLRRLAELAAHAELADVERFRHAHAYVDALLRGRAFSEREARLQRARERADGEVLRFLLDVELGIARIGQDDDEAVIDRLFALFQERTEPAYRRALVLRATQAASEGGRELVQNQFVTAWASGIPAEAPERKYAIALFRTTLLERAYGELREGNGADAAGFFFRAWLNTTSLEAHVGFVEARLALGNLEPREFYTQRFDGRPDDPQLAYVLAYLVARELPTLAVAAGEEAEARFQEAVDEVLVRLGDVDRQQPRSLEVHHLWAHALHLRALRMRDRRAAAGAVHHYGLARDLARERPRYRASTLAGLARLQAALGNHYRAVRHFAARETLPFATTQGELAHRLGAARSLYHARRPAEAQAQAEAALAMIDADPELESHRAHALDRVAFYALDAGDAEGALARYRALRAALPAGSEEQLKAQLGEGAAALRLGRHQDATEAFEAARAALAETAEADEATLATSLVGRYLYSPARTRALLAGLLAEARLGAGDMAGAEEALSERRALLEALAEDDAHDEDLLALAGTYERLGRAAAAQGEVEQAEAFFEEGLTTADAHREATGTSVSAERVALVRAWAELVLFAGGRDVAALRPALRATYRELAALGNPRFREAAFTFEVYLTMLRLPGRVGSERDER